MVLLARFSYKRRDEDERKRLQKEQDHILGSGLLSPYRNDVINQPQY
ncbi:unnamed protein product, partial [Rotaria sordida]